MIVSYYYHYVLNYLKNLIHFLNHLHHYQIMAKALAMVVLVKEHFLSDKNY